MATATVLMNATIITAWHACGANNVEPFESRLMTSCPVMCGCSDFLYGT